MNEPQTSGQAFPTMERGGGGLDLADPGMTLRDYFAAKALQGMLADLPKTLYGLDWMQKTTESAYQVADAMLAARALPHGAPHD
jgi:hypothetical protein